MKGARGLLISITGGPDLTLYEVDEAATRIREEVDPDANIILGATFDESLEGIIRVSVVATGIDMARLSRSARRRQRLRGTARRSFACRAARVHAARVPELRAAAAGKNRNRTPAPAVAARPPHRRRHASVRCAPKPTLFVTAAGRPGTNEDADARWRIHSAAGRAAARPRRAMPRIDELPMPAQN